MLRFLILIVILFSTTLVQAQLYSTRSGVVSFFSSTPLEDIQAKSTSVESKLLSTTGQVSFLMLIKSFRFPNQEMEDHANESYLESDKYPKADFRGTITNIKAINFKKEGTYPAIVKGTLTMHGVTKPVTAKGSVIVKNGKPTATCKFPVQVTDFGINGSIVGKELARSIDVTVNCQYQ